MNNNKSILNEVIAGAPAVFSGTDTPARFIAYAPAASTFNKLVWQTPEGDILTTALSGRALGKGDRPAVYGGVSLAPKPKVKKRGWMVIYKDVNPDVRRKYCSNIYFSYGEAQRCAREDSIESIITVEWEEDPKG